MPSHTRVQTARTRPRRARYAPSADPRESAAALQRARIDLVGRPHARAVHGGQPRDARALSRRALRGVPAWPKPCESLAAARAAGARRPRRFSARVHPARGFVPILMVREQGLWRVDLVETFKSFFFDGEGAYVLGEPALRRTPRSRPAADARSDESMAPARSRRRAARGRSRAARALDAPAPSASASPRS